MTRISPLLLGALAAASIGLAASPASAASPMAAPKVSSIKVAALRTCLDVSTTDPSKYFLDTYGHPCNGSVQQAFAFHPISTGPAHSYTIISKANGQCLDAYRRGIRQESCAGPIPVGVWTLRRVGTTGHRYQMLEANTVGTTSEACVQAYPTPGGYPGPLFQIATCDTNQATQIINLAVAV